MFEPLGMTHTSWRDDYTRIVKGRAMPTATSSDGYHIEMPFENVHGNGGLLTTVGDLLKWNENYDRPVVGDAAVAAEQAKAGHFNDGRALDYALGLFVGDYRGVHNVYHSGSTAGYRAHLNRFPDGTHVGRGAVQRELGRCHASGQHRVGPLSRRPAEAGHARDAACRTAPAMTPPPTAAQLGELAGSYWSDEAEVVLTAAVDEGKLVLKRRPDTTIALTAIERDTFRGSIGTITFRRDAAGKVNAFSVKQDRVWDLRFARTPSRLHDRRLSSLGCLRVGA